MISDEGKGKKENQEENPGEENPGTGGSARMAKPMSSPTKKDTGTNPWSGTLPLLKLPSCKVPRRLRLHLTVVS